MQQASKVKKGIFDDLQNALDEIPPEESYVILGDFNARVGLRSGDRNLWGDASGPFGLGEMNEAGKEFLIFCYSISLQRSTYTCRHGSIQNPKDGTA